MGIRSQNNTNPLAAYLDVFSSTGTDAAAGITPEFGTPQGLTATGGVISDYTTTPGDVYRAHVFTSSGAFNVTDTTSNFGTNVEYLVVAGGGAGGQSGPGGYGGAGGGGAGGFRTNVPGHPLAAGTYPVSVTPYTVTVGAGGARYAINGNYGKGFNGGNSVFGSITSTGGGGGGGGGPSSPYGDANPGGSGGGGGYQIPAAGTAVVTTPAQGFAGGNGSGGGGSGGGGATEVGSPNPGDAGADGGDGSSIAIETSTARTYAGGGGGGGYAVSNASGGSGGSGGAGNGGSGGSLATLTGGYGTSSTGGGGGGAGNTGGTTSVGGNGGSGIVVVRYQIGRATAAAKATGGAISFYNGKTIHTFTNSGTFNAPASISGVEYVLIGGGGGGNSYIGGGGGSGAFVYSNGSPETITLAATAYPVIIGAGGNIGSPDNQGQAGADTIWNGYTAGGGGGGQRNNPDTNTVGRTSTVPSGSAVGAAGGGGSGNGSEAGAAGGSPGGYAGGNGNDPSLGSGGGGGSGGAGGNAPSNVGGIGRQLPSTFRNPVSVTALGYPGPTGSVPGTNPGGDTTGKYWVAGGGGGGARRTGPQSQTGGDGGGGSGVVGGATPNNVGYDFTGAGIGVGSNHPGLSGGNAGSNSGSGGGGGRDTGDPTAGGQGGSGLLLIAYPT